MKVFMGDLCVTWERGEEHKCLRLGLKIEEVTLIILI